MNLWPLFRASSRPALWTTLRALLLMWVALSGSALAQSEYISTPPASAVVNDQAPYDVTVSFAFERIEPASVKYPVVYWYINGNYVGQKTSTLQSKTVDGGGQSHYNFYDPYGNSGRGRTYQGEVFTNVPNTGKIIWNNSWPAAAGGSTALYTAYIPDLATFSPPAQIVVAAAQPAGGVRPQLQIVKSPTSVSQAIGGAASFFGDAQSHVNGLMQNPYGVAVDAQGMVYVADTLNHTIRKITPGGKGRTIAGLDGVLLGTEANPDDTTNLAATTDFTNKLGSITVAILNGQEDVSTLKVLKQEGPILAPNYRLVYTGSLSALWASSKDAGAAATAGTLGSTSDLVVASLAADKVTFYATGALNAGSLSGVASGPTGNAGTLTFDVYDPYPAHAIFKERAPVSGPAFTADPTSNPTVAVDLITDQGVGATSYRRQNEARYASRALNGQDPEPLFNAPESLTTADDGSIYVADTANKAIRRIYFDSNGDTRVRTLIAGSLLFSQDSDGGVTWKSGSYINPGVIVPAVDFNQPRGIVFDTTTSVTDTTGAKAPVLYVLDFNSIKKITLNSGTIVAGVAVPGGSCVTSVSYIGNVSQSTGWKGDVGVARLYSPRGMVLTSEDDGKTPVLYVADTVNHVIRKLYLPVSSGKGLTPDTATPNDWVSEVVAGLVGAKALATGTSADGTTGYYPKVLIPGCTTDGTSRMTVPSTVGVQVGDSIAVAGGTFAVSKVLSPGTLELGGSPTAISGTVATLQSKAVSKVNLARLSYPSGLAIDKYRNLYFTEMGSHEVRRVIIDSNNPGVSARVQTLAGKGSPGPLDGSTGEGTGISASFFYPAGIVYDSSGPTPSLLVADSANHSIRRVAIKTTTLPTILGNASKGSYVVAVSSTSGLQKLMPVTGVNVSPGAIITDINGASKTVTLNLPVTGTLTNTTLTATQDTFSSTTALGFPGVKGNRDFSYECSEFTYQWRKYGKALQNINTRSLGDTVIAGADTPSLTLSNLSERDSGPYELSITNKFSVTGETAQASLYVTPAASEEPKFLAPGYAQLSVVDGSDLTQLRPDLNGGVIDLALQAYVTPADAVSYQWQVYTGLVSNGTAAGLDSEWINLSDTATSQNTKAASVLGVDGSGGLSLVGTNTSSLKIGGFQKSLIDYNAVNTPKIKLPPALFRVICKPQDGRQDPQPVELDLSDNIQQPFLVQASYAPVIETGASSSIRWDETPFIYGEGQQATLSGGESHVLILTARALVSAYPTAPGKDPNNPLVRAQYQWMVSDKDPSDVTSVPVPVPDIGGSGDCFLAVEGNPLTQVSPQIQISFGLNADPLFYFVRYWTGSGGYADASTRIGEYVDGDYIKIVANLAVSVGSIGYADGETTPPEAPVKIVYVNAPTESFQLEAIVDSASSKPIFSWEYLPWGADAASQWKTLYLGTLTSGAVSAGMSGSMRVSGAISAGDPLNSGTLLGNGSISETLTRASLSFTSISKEAGDLSLNKDISGLYRLTATVDGISQHKDWVVAVRQKPYPKTGTNTYSLSTAAGGAVPPGSPLILNTASKPSVTMQANVIFPSPDTRSVGEVFDSVYQNPSMDDDYSWYTPNTDASRPFVDQYATAQKYRWMRGAVKVLPGTEEGTVYTIDGGTFQLANISGSKAFGTYSLTVTNACGTVPNLGPEQASSGQRGWTLLSNGLPELSQSEALVKSTVGDTLLSIRGGTLFQRVAEGQTVALEIPVASSYPLRYIWSKKNGSAWDSLPGYPLTGLPDSKYLIRAAKLLDSGTYRVKVGYVTGSGSSAAPTFLSDTRELTLLVEPAPSPAAPKVEVAGKVVTPVSGVYRLAFGSTATLSAMNNARLLFSGSLQTQFYAFQWKKNGVALVGQTGETLSLAGVSKAQAGVYTVDVSGVAGTKASPPVSVSVTAISSNIDTLYNLTVENVSKVKYTLSPSPTKGLAPGTIVSITGMSSDSQTLLGWRVSDEKGNSWNIERSSKFVMPGSHLKVSAVLGRPSIGMYSGFLSLELPWDKSQEWAIHSEDKPVTPGASSVRGYFTAMVTSLATLSGKILIEGKSYAFTSPMTFKPDGTLSGIIKIQAPLSNPASPSTPTPWNLSGTASLDMGLVLSGSLASGSNVIPVSDSTQLAALALDMSVSTYGLPDGTTINEIDRVNGTITVSLAATMDTGWVPMIVGANAAATHNVMHVKLNDVVLEKTPPKMTSGQTLYCTAACNAGAYNALRQFIADSPSGSEGTPNVTSVTPGAAQTFTAAVFRYGSKDPSSCFGRGGALSTSVSALGLASVTGYLPNGSKLTYAGYIGRACLVPDKLTPAPLLPFVSIAKETEQTDAFGVPQDIAGTAVEIMQENLVRQTSSISIPIWSTSPAGDSVAEPLFGALLISDKVLEGCLGVLNSLPVIRTGLEPSGSEYTHNYVFGYLYEPTPPSGSQKVYPYTSTAKITLSTIAPSSDAATFPLEDVSQPIFLGKLTSMGNLGGTGSNIILTPSAAGALLIQGDSFTLDNKTGLLLGSHSEPTSRYVSISQVLTSPSTGPSWAYTVPQAEPKVLSTSFKTSLSVRTYAVTIQGGQGSIFGNAGGASGFLMRGTAGLDSLKNVLGNGSQDPFLKAPYSTYRTEGFIMNAYEPY